MNREEYIRGIVCESFSTSDDAKLPNLLYLKASKDLLSHNYKESVVDWVKIKVQLIPFDLRTDHIFEIMCSPVKDNQAYDWQPIKKFFSKREIAEIERKANFLFIRARLNGKSN